MFLKKYLNELYYELLIEKYGLDYLNSISENNFIQVYNLFKEYNFYFIDDIILKYLEIFSLDFEFVNNKILNLKNQLGDKFIYLIGDDMRYLETILNQF